MNQAPCVNKLYGLPKTKSCPLDRVIQLLNNWCTRCCSGKILLYLSSIIRYCLQKYIKQKIILTIIEIRFIVFNFLISCWCWWQLAILTATWVVWIIKRIIFLSPPFLHVFSDNFFNSLPASSCFKKCVRVIFTKLFNYFQELFSTFCVPSKPGCWFILRPYCFGECNDPLLPEY